MKHNKLYSAISHSLIGKTSLYLVQFACLAIYARVFTPEQFGIIASIQVFMIFFQLLSDVGFGPAIINHNSFCERKRDGIFSFSIIFGAMLAIIFYMLSFLISDFYGGYDYSSIAIFVSLTILFSSFTSVPLASINKDAKFIRLGMIEMISEALALVGVLVLAHFDFGVASLAAKSTIQTFTRFCLLHNSSKLTTIGKPRLGSQLYHIKDIASFSAYQLSFNIINYFSRNLDNILIGKYIGVTQLGVYEKSYQLMRYPLMLTSFALTPAIQPILNKNRNNVEYIIDEHNILSSKLLVLSTIIATFIYTNPEGIVSILFGKQWLNVVPIIKTFCIIIPFQAVLCTSGAFYQLMGKPKLLFISGAFAALINVGFIVYGIYLGTIENVAQSYTVGYIINFFLGYFFLFKFCFKRGSWSFYKALANAIKAVAPALVLYITCFGVFSYIEVVDYLVFFLNVFSGLFSLYLFRFEIKKIMFLTSKNGELL